MPLLDEKTISLPAVHLIIQQCPITALTNSVSRCGCLISMTGAWFWNPFLLEACRHFLEEPASEILCNCVNPEFQMCKNLGIKDASVSWSHGYTQKWNVLLLLSEASLFSWWPYTKSKEIPKYESEKANDSSSLSIGFFKEICPSFFVRKPQVCG